MSSPTANPAKRAWLSLEQSCFLAAAILYACYRWTILSGVEPLSFSDSTQYLNQYRDGFKRGFLFRNRPVAYPLFLWLMRYNLPCAMAVQRGAAIAAWLALAWMMRGLFTTLPARAISFTCTLVASLALNVLQWDVCIMTESLTFSIFALICGCWFGIARASGRSTLFEAGLASLAILFAALRDDKALFLPLFAILMLIAWMRRFVTSGMKFRSSKRIAVFATPISSLVMIVFFLLQARAMHSTGRGWANTLDVLSLRVFINRDGSAPVLDQGNLHWMVEKYGMPEEGARRVGLEAYDLPPVSAGFKKWLKNEGARAWPHFLLTHPAWTWNLFSRPPSLFGDEGTRFMNIHPSEWNRASLAIPRLIHKTTYVAFGWLLGADRLHVLLLFGVILGFGLWVAAIFSPRLRSFERFIAEGMILPTVALLAVILALVGDAIGDWRHALIGLIGLHVAAPWLLGWIVEESTLAFLRHR